VLILSRHRYHASQALAALRAGKHVFVEKPMALTIDECRALCRAAAETGSQLTVGFNRRFAPFYLEQKRQLVKRRGPAVLNCRVNSPSISGDYWMADPGGGGAIVGEACHFVDLMYWLLEAEPIGVTAFSLPTESREPIGQNNLVASFRFADGSIGNLTYCTIGGPGAGHECVEAYAPGVSAAVEDFKRLTVHGQGARNRTAWFPDKGHRAQLVSFLARIRRGEAPEVTAVDGSRATIVCLQLLEANRSRVSHAANIDWAAALS
jgi:predicted dehydrogenase